MRNLGSLIMLTEKQPSASVKPESRMDSRWRGLPIIALSAGGIATYLLKLRKENFRISAHHEEIKFHCLQERI